MRRFQFTEDEKTALERLGVEAVVLFGSQALGLARRGSDYDFGILIKQRSLLRVYEGRKKLYDELYNILSEKVDQLVNIDIVFLEHAPAELQSHAIKHGVPIYESNPNIFVNFKEYVMLTEADFEPYRNLFQRAILSRI
jgi:predicted nucleotidyltransferase